MKLLTDELREKMPKLYSQEKHPNPPVICKFFTPWANWTWWVLEGQPVIDEETGKEIDYEFFGLVQGHETEFGYFCLNELESITGFAGLKIERDLWFDERPVKTLPAYKEQWGDGGPYEGSPIPEPIIPHVWKPTPEAEAEFDKIDLELLTGSTSVKGSAFFVRLFQVEHPDTIRLALRFVESDSYRVALLNKRLAELEGATAKTE